MPPALVTTRSAAAMRRCRSGTKPNTRSDEPATSRSSDARSPASWPATRMPTTGRRMRASTLATSGRRPTEPHEPAIASTTGTSAGSPSARRISRGSGALANSVRTGTPVTTARARERGHGQGGRGVHGDHRVGRQALEEGGEPPPAHARGAEGQRRVAGEPVTERVGEPPHRRQAAKQREIHGTRRAVEERVHEVAEVVDDDRLGATPRDLRGDAAGGLVVARAIGCGEDQDAAHRPILPRLDRPGSSG